MKTNPLPIVKKVGDQFVIEDPVAYEVIKAINKNQTKTLFDLNAERIEYFKGRWEVNTNKENICIVIINVDDENGSVVADILMPNHDWQSYRDKGELPVARGLAGIDFIIDALGFFDISASEKLRTLKGTPCVVVIDQLVAEIYE